MVLPEDGQPSSELIRTVNIHQLFIYNIIPAIPTLALFNLSIHRSLRSTAETGE
jgi:hypothetical protein